MKKGILTFILSSLFLLNFLPAWGEQPIIIRWGTVMPPDHPQVKGTERIAEIVAKRTDNRMQIQIFPSSQLGSGKDMVEATAMGAQQVVAEGAAMLASWVPRFGILECPYIFRDMEHLYKALNSPIGQELKDEVVAKKGLRILGGFYYGVRHLTTSKKPVYSIEDVKGLKLRTPDVPLLLEMAKSWGAKPTPMAFAEVYLALQQGVVDGQENPLPTIDSAKFYEVQKYLMLTGHILQAIYVIMNEKFWQSLSPEYQKILQEAIEAGIEHNNKLIIEKEKALIEKFKERGMTVIVPDVESFRRATNAGVPPKFEAKWGQGLYEKVVSVR